MGNYYAAKKPLPLITIISILVCFTLSAFACGSESLPIIEPTNLSLVGSTPSVMVSTTGATNSPVKITTVETPTVVTVKIEPTPSTVATNQIQNNWIKAIPCRAPCWENITPGKTTPEEAQKLLKSNPAISNIQIEDPKFGNKPVAIYWTLVESPQIRGLLSYHIASPQPYVELIKPAVTPYKLKDVLALYGEPSHIIVMDKTNELGRATGQYKIYLIYLNQGLLLSNPSTEISIMTPDTNFTELYFFTPGIPGFNILDAQDDLVGKLMVKWEGFKDIMYYCRFQTATSINKC
jgi:hypothetical protein